MGLLLKTKKEEKLKNECNKGGSADKDEKRKIKKMSAITVGLLLKMKKGKKF